MKKSTNILSKIECFLFCPQKISFEHFLFALVKYNSMKIEDRVKYGTVGLGYEKFIVEHKFSEPSSAVKIFYVKFLQEILNNVAFD